MSHGIGRRGFLAVAGLAAVLGAVGGCNRAAEGTAAGGVPKVVTTVNMVTDLVRRVAGDAVTVEELMGPGVDPHLYKQKASDTARMLAADRVFYSGLHLEGLLVKILEDNPKGRAVTREIPEDRLLSGEAGQHDPHVWFDVSLWIFALGTVEKDLCELVPAQAARFHQNAAAYRKELEALHAETKAALAAIPKERRVLVTSHDAFRYFGRAYDVEVHGLQGISTASEAGLKEVQRVVDLLVTRQVKAVFAETSVPPDGIRAVIARCQERGHTVKQAEGELFSDAMDAPDKPGGTYPGMIRHNVETIAGALK